MKIIQLFILVLAFLIIPQSQAGVLLEPVLGYSLHKHEIDSDGESEEKGNGVSMGGRIGYQNLGFQLGIDYLRSSIGMDDNDFKEDLTTTEWAAFAGFEFPILARVYAGYIFSAQAESEVTGGNKFKLSDGTGMKLGVGFTGLPFIDINVEYRKGTYSEVKLGSLKDSVDTDFSAFMIGISLPFVI